MNVLNKIDQLTQSHPLTTTTSIVLLVVLMQQLASALITAINADLTKDMFGSYIRYTASALIVFLLWKWRVLSDIGVSRPLK